MITLHMDRGALARPTETSTGDLEISGHAARVHTVGDGLDYGDHHEYRTIDEVRRIVDQLVGAPVTWSHPDRMVRGDASAAIIGRVTAAHLDGEHAAVRIAISDRNAARAIRAGAAVELSLGYECHTDAHGFQRGVKVDHLAVVERARCGATCRLSFDNATYTKGLTEMLDKDLLTAAAAMNLKTDGESNRTLANKVLIACGVDPKARRASDRSETIDAMPDAYAIARAVSAVEYGARDIADAARRDSFATSQRTDAPSCGCGGGHLNQPVKLDAIGAERKAREDMLKRGRLAHVQHADEERRSEVEAIDGYESRRTHNRVGRAAPIRSDAGMSAEAKARAAAAEYSANAWRNPNASTDDEETGV